MLELAVLGLLKEQPLHGYELKKRLGETLGFLWGVSYGSLYPALRRLERAGAIEIVLEPQAAPDPRPPTGSITGDLAAARRAAAARLAKGTRRTRKAYRITERGEALFIELLLADDAAADDEKAFALKLAFCGHLPREPRARAPRTPARRRCSPGSSARAAPRARRTDRADRAERPRPRSLLAGARRAPHPVHPARPRVGRRAHRRRAARPPGELPGRAVAPDRQPFPGKEPPHEPQPDSPKVRVAIAGVGNCASSLVQGVEYYRDADPDEDVPGLMHVGLGGYHVGDVEFVAAFDVDADKVGLDLGKAIAAGPEQHDQVRRGRRARRAVQRGPTFDGLGEFYRDTVEESPGGAGRRRAGAARRARRRPRELPPGRLRGCAAPLRAGLPRRRRRLRERDPRLHRQQPGVGAEVRRRGRADRRRRHQEPGRRHDRAPDPRPPLRGPRCGARPHVPAQLRRQHGLQEHAGAQAPEVQEDLEDAVGHEPDRPGHRGRRTSTSARPTTCRGSTTASGPTSGSRAATSATCR